METTYQIGVVIGRFQGKELTSAHLKLLSFAAQCSTQVVVLLGVSPIPCSFENPVPILYRKKLIEDACPKATVIPLSDVEDNEVWSDQVDNVIASVTMPHDEVCIYGGRDSFIPYYTGRFKAYEYKMDNEDFTSATQARHDLGKYISLLPSFAHGIIYATQNQWSNPQMCVDVALCDGDGMILLGRKKGKTSWCFPGGFVDVTDKSLELAALRELEEETGVKITTQDNVRDRVFYISSHLVTDWRYKGREKILTAFFVVEPDGGILLPKAGDDLEEVRWFGIHDNETYMALGSNHRLLLTDLINQIKESKNE